MSTVKMTVQEARQFKAWWDRHALTSETPEARSYLMRGKGIDFVQWVNKSGYGHRVIAAYRQAKSTLSDVSEMIEDVATIANGRVTQADIDRMINPRMPTMQERIVEARAELKALRLDAFGEASIGDGNAAPTASDQRQRAADMLTQHRASVISNPDYAIRSAEGFQMIRALKNHGMQADSAVATAAMMVDAESTVDLSALSDGDISALLMWLVPKISASEKESENA